MRALKTLFDRILCVMAVKDLLIKLLPNLHAKRVYGRWNHYDVDPVEYTKTNYKKRFGIELKFVQ